MNNTTSPYMTTEEAAEYLRVSTHTIRYYVHNQSIPYKKLGKNGRRILFTRDDLDKFMREPEEKNDIKKQAEDIIYKLETKRIKKAK